MTILIGDYNLVDPDEGRLMALMGERIFDKELIVVAREDLFAESVEVVADGFSRRQLRGGDLHLLSRKDRCWLQLNAEHVARLHIQVVYTGSMASPRIAERLRPVGVHHYSSQTGSLSGNSAVGHRTPTFCGDLGFCVAFGVACGSMPMGQDPDRDRVHAYRGGDGQGESARGGPGPPSQDPEVASLSLDAQGRLRIQLD